MDGRECLLTETTEGEMSSSVDNSIINQPERSCTDSDDALLKQSGSVWGDADAIDGGYKQSNGVTLADIMKEQETEKIKQEKSTSSVTVKFSNDVESEEERMMRLAIEASLRDQQRDKIEEAKDLESVMRIYQESNSEITPKTHDDSDDMDEDMKMAIALSLASNSTSNNNCGGNIISDDVVVGDEDESKELALARQNAAIEEYNSPQTADEAASLALALQLQREEDARHLSNITIENANRAAQLKREAMCRGDTTGITGIRTVDRDEFKRMQGAKSNKGYGNDGDRIAARRRDEERGMGKLLNSHYPDNPFGEAAQFSSDDADYYYYANGRFAEDDHDDDHDEKYFGIKMNSQSASSSWQRVDKDTFIGPNNEIKSKHDPELKHKSNAMNLLDGNARKSTSMSDRAYNSFRRSEARQSGMKKGVSTQGHGRAENMNASKTRGGMDGNVRLQIAAAVNLGIINRCNGVVKEGKEGLVYHAESGREGRKNINSSMQEIGSDGFDVAVKVFKRISLFRNRKDYVDGDSRYKQAFKTNDAREQVVLWTEKEYRNLLRAWRGGVSVPKPLYQSDNILFMRFLGENGWPSPQLREIGIKKGSSRWTTLYCQTFVAIRRLYHCARLVHGDMSEYNILICPKWQVKKDFMFPDERSTDDEDLQVVLIDFGQAVETKHVRAEEYLRRDLSTVTHFFSTQGIATLSIEQAEEFVTDANFRGGNDTESDADDPVDSINPGFKEEEEFKKKGIWRNIAARWDETRDTEALIARLERGR